MHRRSGLRADHSRCHHDGIGAHGHSSDGLCLPTLLPEELQKYPPGQLGAAGVKRGGAAIDVVVTLDSGREREIPQAKRVFRQEIEKLVASGGSHAFTLEIQRRGSGKYLL